MEARLPALRCCDVKCDAVVLRGRERRDATRGLMRGGRRRCFAKEEMREVQRWRLKFPARTVVAGSWWLSAEKMTASGTAGWFAVVVVVTRRCRIVVAGNGGGCRGG